MRLNLQRFSLITQVVRAHRGDAILRQLTQIFSLVFQLTAPDSYRKNGLDPQTGAGTWRVQVRRKGRSASENFVRYEDAKRWSVDAERQIDRGETPTVSRVGKLKTLSDLIDLHISDMKEVGKAPGRTKEASLAMLKRELGSLNMVAVDRERIVKFGRARAKEGAGPVTLSMDVGLIKLVLQHAAAVHGLPVKVEPVDLGRVALKRLGLIGKSNERDRRPTEEELEKLFRYGDGNDRQLIPMTPIVKFAIATAMRQEEIHRVTWDDLNTRTKMLLIRDRKDPRQKKGNDQRIPLLVVSGYDAMALIEEQRALRANDDDRIFPYNQKSVSTAFTRSCQELDIEDLHFHDMRHEGTSRLFEAGFRIEQVALVTGHKDWKMLRRYTHLKPEALHEIAASRVA